jgi:hypothetical protein
MPSAAPVVLPAELLALAFDPSARHLYIIARDGAVQTVYLGSARLEKPRWLTALGEARVGAQLSRAGLDIEWLPETERRRARAEVTKMLSRAAAQRDAGAARIQDTSALTR